MSYTCFKKSTHAYSCNFNIAEIMRNSNKMSYGK